MKDYCYTVELQKFLNETVASLLSFKTIFTMKSCRMDPFGPDPLSAWGFPA